MTWTAPVVDRVDPPLTAGERESLQGWLTFHRDTLVHKCAGLTGDQLVITSVEPSNLTLLGLVRHMAEVERWWFRRCFAGLDIDDVFCSEAYPDGDFDLIDPAKADADFATFSEECQLADATVAERGLDEEFFSPRQKTMNLRWIYLHMIEEYSRHNGHADLLRERIDGVTGD
jgi:uncharacterized damage-inducible protein DinB